MSAQLTDYEAFLYLHSLWINEQYKVKIFESQKRTFARRLIVAFPDVRSQFSGQTDFLAWLDETPNVA